MPKAGLPRGIWCGSALAASEPGEVGTGFDLDAKRGKVEIVCEMYGEGGSLREACTRRRSHSHPLYILRTASRPLDCHKSYSVVGAFV